MHLSPLLGFALAEPGIPPAFGLVGECGSRHASRQWLCTWVGHLGRAAPCTQTSRMIESGPTAQAWCRPHVTEELQVSSRSGTCLPTPKLYRAYANQPSSRRQACSQPARHVPSRCTWTSLGGSTRRMGARLGAAWDRRRGAPRFHAPRLRPPRLPAACAWPVTETHQSPGPFPAGAGALTWCLRSSLLVGGTKKLAR
jgi:hypothetical protein